MIIQDLQEILVSRLIDFDLRYVALYYQFIHARNFIIYLFYIEIFILKWKFFINNIV